MRKGLAVTSLVIGILSFLTLGCLGVGGLLGLVLGIVALVKANRHPQEYGGKGLAIGGIVTSALGLAMLPMAGIVAAIAIPSLLRARVSANEASAIGDTRTVISAQAAYQSANAGYFEGRMECLQTPSQCIPNYSGPTFLDASLASLLPKSGYARSLHAGQPVDPGARPSEASPSSVSAFAYISVPVTPNQTGVRAFCGDATGMICSTADGHEPSVENGACDTSTCSPLS